MSKPRSEAERHFDEHIGRHITATRNKKGITRVELARILGIDHRRLYWMETGGRCSLYLAAQIAHVLDGGLFDAGRQLRTTRVDVGRGVGGSK